MNLRFVVNVLASVALAAFSSLATAQQGHTAAQNKVVRINQIQVIGTHNSYHAGFGPSEMKYLKKNYPKVLHGLAYRHRPLNEQFSAGIRQIELDIFADPKGGRYAHPEIDRLVAAAGLPLLEPFDPRHEMEKPGFKVMHMQGLDERSVCPTFSECLVQVRSWSRAHPRHLPIFILVETKTGTMRDLPEPVTALPFTSEVFDRMDREILSVFKRSEVITPDDVRGSYPTLVSAVHAEQWPTLSDARGKVVFLLDQRWNEPIYTKSHPSLRGRIAFTNAAPGDDDAAFTEQNHGSVAEISQLVKQGYLVRTGADWNTVQARTGSTTRRDIALASGAQIVSTDYPPSAPSRWTGYFVQFPGGLTARCNPVNGPKGCASSLLSVYPHSGWSVRGHP